MTDPNADTGKWQPYPAYRDSGVAWLGEIPGHWESKRLKNIITACQNGVWGDDPQNDENDLVCVRVADFDRVALTISVDNFTYRNIPENQHTSRMLKQGDLLLEKSGGGEKQPVGAVMLFNLDIPAVTSNFIARMPVAEGFSSKYLVFLYSALYSGRINTRSIKQNTGIQNLDSTQYLNEIVGIPPLDEQAAIATFLDRETAKINALITKKRDLIALLDEQRRAVISHAVTKGLDPTAPMKDSGVDWLGEIPPGWEKTRIKFVSYLKGRLGWQNLRAEEYTDEGPYVVSSAQFKKEEIQWEQCPHVTLERYEMDTNIQLAAQDILLMKDGAALGKLAFVTNLPDKACLNSHLLLFRPQKTDNSNDFYYPRYMFHLLYSTSFQYYIQITATGSTFLGVSQQSVGNYVLFLPPLYEQHEIADFIDGEISKIDRLIIETRASINQLQEYRTALISAAVTGKIDVRGEV